MRSLRPKFLLAAALLTTSSALQAARFWPTSPLIQVGNDTDIFFDGSASLGFNDNLFSQENKVSGTSLTLAPGFTLEYAKDSPFSVTANFKRSQISYYGGGNLSRLNNSQDTMSGTALIDQGGPLKLTLSSSYSESARNDNLTSLGVDGTTLGETLVRQGNYTHNIKADYRLTEKINSNVTIGNSYNRYLNPTKIQTPDASPNPNNYFTDTYNTNALSEINTKSVALNLTYQTPGEQITYGFNYSHDQNDFSPAAYYRYVYNVPPVGPVTSRSWVTGDVIKSAKDLYAFTASGKLSRSGKLSLNTKLGFSSTNTTKFAAASTTLSGLSYNIDLKHQLTEVVDHSLSLGRTTSPTPSGEESLAKSYSYTVNYGATDSLSLNLRLSKSDVLVGTTAITTMGYNLGAVYNYNSHLSFNATLDSLQTKLSTSSYRANSFVIQASFRY
jgi:hypothetical protein